VLARAHQRLIWERTRHLLRLRSALREFFPAALVAFGDDLAGADALELLAAAPDPASAARLSPRQISAALQRARRRQVSDKAEVIRAALRTEQLGQPEVVTAAYAAAVRAQTAILATLQVQIKTLQGQVEAHLAATRTRRSTCPSPAWAAFSAPGYSVSSVTTRTATPAPEPARTTPTPARSPANPARRRLCTPGTCTMTGSLTRSAARPNRRSTRHPAPAPTTTSCAIEAPAIPRPCAS
jgi:hypothetical protein